jgi:predicted nucleic acid-binding protein
MTVLDTCVLSESLKPDPDPRLISWIDGLDEGAIYITAFTVGELEKEIERLGPGKKRDALRSWLEQLRVRFTGRILPFDEESAIMWGDMSARLASEGRTAPAIDSLIAAVILRHEAVLATRNEGDFTSMGIRTVNPWQ